MTAGTGTRDVLALVEQAPQALLGTHARVEAAAGKDEAVLLERLAVGHLTAARHFSQKLSGGSRRVVSRLRIFGRTTLLIQFTLAGSATPCCCSHTGPDCGSPKAPMCAGSWTAQGLAQAFYQI